MIDKKVFNKLKDEHRASALQFFLEEIDRGAISPGQKDSFLMGFEAGLGFVTNLYFINEFKDDSGNESK